MDYEQFKERIEEDLHQALADHGIDVNLSQHHVEKPTRIYVKNFMDMESIRFAYLIGTAVLEITIHEGDCITKCIYDAIENLANISVPVFTKEGAVNQIIIRVNGILTSVVHPSFFICAECRSP